MFGTRIIETEAALADTDEPNFPPSRHRSKRLHKKLLKRHGYKKQPCSWHIGGVIYMHPVRYREMVDAIDKANERLRLGSN